NARSQARADNPRVKHPRKLAPHLGELKCETIISKPNDTNKQKTVNRNGEVKNRNGAGQKVKHRSNWTPVVPHIRSMAVPKHIAKVLHPRVGVFKVCYDTVKNISASMRAGIIPNQP